MAKFMAKVEREEERGECDWCGKKQNQFGEPRMTTIKEETMRSRGINEDGESIDICEHGCLYEMIHFVQKSKDNRIKEIKNSKPCKACEGKGYTETFDSDHDPVDEPCTSCDGLGRVSK